MDTRNENRPVLIPRGVSDPAGTTGFVANLTGGILAVDLLSGTRLWQTADASRPLLVVDALLAAQKNLSANTLQILWLDIAQKGAVQSSSEPLIFPDWVQIGNQDDENFQLDVYAVGEQLFLSWEAHTYYRGGAAPSAKVMQRNTQTASGQFRIAQDSGRVWEVVEPNVQQSHALEPNILLPEVEADAIDPEIVGDTLYYLVARPYRQDSQQIILTAKSLTSDKVLWQLPVDEQRASKPPPLRR